jgi:hypothetical protein
MEIIDNFQDEEFKFNYETIDPTASYRFNQQIESFYFPLRQVKRRDNSNSSFNYMNTATINLFDKTIPRAEFHAHQFHFHSPSEHSIDGKLMDLEMHIVHKIQKELHPHKTEAEDPNDINRTSQFVGGVLAFLFKVMPDSYFVDRSKENPEILFHDAFLLMLVDE